ncbi:UDP-N-acetylmuramoyl-tripeptide--D-alanyl-D-alanine ligase [Thermovibrio sp.]
MSSISARKLAEIVKGELLGRDFTFKGVHFDSRQIKEGELFIPLKGKTDGHAYIEDSFKKGAVGALSEKPFSPPPSKFLIKVNDTLSAFKDLALYKRRKFRGTTVAITGSVGKSTTKELLYYLFSNYERTYRNPKSFNNLIGLFYTLSNLPSSSLYLQELGTNSPGEIEELRELLKPDLAVITKVALAHTEGFKDLKGVIKEKFSLTKGVSVSIVPFELKERALSDEVITFGKEGDVRLTSLNLSPFETSFKVNAFGKELSFKTSVPGYSVVNATLIAVALGNLLSLPVNEFPELLANFTPPLGRLTVEDFGSTLLIDDSYNANPASVENALKVLSLFKEEKVFIFGEMLELGELSEEEHKKVGELANSVGVSFLLTLGNRTLETFKAFKGDKRHFSSLESLIEFVNKMPLKNKVILVKGSRSNNLDLVSETIRKRLKS